MIIIIQTKQLIQNIKPQFFPVDSLVNILIKCYTATHDIKTKLTIRQSLFNNTVEIENVNKGYTFLKLYPLSQNSQSSTIYLWVGIKAWYQFSLFYIEKGAQSREFQTCGSISLSNTDSEKHNYYSSDMAINTPVLLTYVQKTYCVYIFLY